MSYSNETRQKIAQTELKSIEENGRTARIAILSAAFVLIGNTYNIDITKIVELLL